MNFDYLNNQKFLKIIKNNYFLKDYKIKIHDFELNFLQSRFLLNAKIFTHPFFFFQSSNWYIEKNFSKYWGEVIKFSTFSKQNIVVKSCGDINLNNGIHIGNNPILNLKNFSNNGDILNNVSSNLKKNIKRNINNFRKENLIVKLADCPEEIKQFYYLYSKIYVKKFKVPFNGFKLINDLLTCNSRIFIIKKNKKILGGAFFIMDKNIIHYIWGAYDNYKNINLTTILIFYIIEKKFKNFDYLNFGNTPLSNINLFNYKMSWGCENKKNFIYHTINKNSSFSVDNSEIIKKLYSSLNPKFISNVMPLIHKAFVF
jgi:hypothetical protein